MKDSFNCITVKLQVNVAMKRHGQFAVFYALNADQLFGNPLNLPALAPENRHFEVIVGIEMIPRRIAVCHNARCSIREQVLLQ